MKINGNAVAEGAIVSGTLRDEDLIRAFAAEIRKLSLRTPGVVLDAESWLCGREKYNDNISGEEHPLDENEYVERGGEISLQLQTHLEGMAPTGWRFGTGQDGDDFGWWRTEE